MANLKDLDNRIKALTNARQGLTLKDRGEIQYIERSKRQTQYEISKLASAFLAGTRR